MSPKPRYTALRRRRTVFIRFDTICACDGRPMDGHKCYRLADTARSIAACGENV